MYIRCDHVQKVIGKNVVLNSVSLDLKGGGIIGLRGKNGCGKTMLMRVICGLVRPTSGFVDINGCVLGKTATFPPSVGVLIENPAFLSGESGFQNLKLLAGIKGICTDETIREIMTSFELDPEDKRPYRKYSLGMKQKLGIACAIMEKPELIILDEPLNALDEKSSQAVKKRLNLLKNKDRIILIACHDKEEMDLLADEVYLMENGSIVGKEGE